MISNKTLEKLVKIETPFYFFDLDVLRSTWKVLKKSLTIPVIKYIMQ
jgi:hypothetical protein